MLGKQTLNTWATTQSSEAMSSAEAEYNAMVEGFTCGFGMQTLWNEMGIESGVLPLSTDSSSAKWYASKWYNIEGFNNPANSLT